MPACRLTRLQLRTLELCTPRLRCTPALSGCMACAMRMEHSAASQGHASGRSGGDSSSRERDDRVAACSPPLHPPGQTPWTPVATHTHVVHPPEQLRQTNTPRLTLAQVGPRDPQSAQRRFSSCFSSADRMALCRSFCCAVTLSLSLRTMARRCGGRAQEGGGPQAGRRPAPSGQAGSASALLAQPCSAFAGCCRRLRAHTC